MYYINKREREREYFMNDLKYMIKNVKFIETVLAV